ncbi:MAG: S41 family peptidase [Blastocatellia bacterium]|nr:S41 family peptidase [Blastocatellia bacterium]
MRSPQRALCLALVSIFFFFSGPVWAQQQTEPSNRIPAKDLQADFTILRKAYEALHPGLYRYQSKVQMDAEFTALQTELNHDLTLPEAYLAISRFLAKVKCGHSYPNFYNQPKAIANKLFQNANRVPFHFRWIDRRMIVTRNFSEETRLRPGSQILKLNGIPVGVILDRLLTVARADGSNQAKRIANLEVRGFDRYEAFDIYFPLFFPFEDQTFSLEVRFPGQTKATTLKVKPLTYEQRLAPIKTAVENQKGGDQPLFEFRWLDAKTGYLRMPTWALYDSKWDWKAYLDNVFTQLQTAQAGHLILDVRENEGGLDVGNYIIGKLISRNLTLNTYERLVRYRKVPDDLAPFLDTWDPSFKDWGEAATPRNDGFYRLKRYDDGDAMTVIEGSSKPYQGRIYVLVGATNSSATFQFAQIIQQNKLGLLVGQPTGGNQRGITGGAFFFLRLPNSKIEVDVPLIGQYPATEQPDGGLLPDIAVTPRIADIARGVDTELETVKKLTRQGR